MGLGNQKGALTSFAEGFKTGREIRAGFQRERLLEEENKRAERRLFLDELKMVQQTLGPQLFEVSQANPEQVESTFKQFMEQNPGFKERADKFGFGDMNLFSRSPGMVSVKAAGRITEKNFDQLNAWSVDATGQELSKESIGNPYEYENEPGKKKVFRELVSKKPTVSTEEFKKRKEIEAESEKKKELTKREIRFSDNVKKSINKLNIDESLLALSDARATATSGIALGEKDARLKLASAALKGALSDKDLSIYMVINESIPRRVKSIVEKMKTGKLTEEDREEILFFLDIAEQNKLFNRNKKIINEVITETKIQKGKKQRLIDIVISEIKNPGHNIIAKFDNRNDALPFLTKFNDRFEGTGAKILLPSSKDPKKLVEIQF